VCSLGAKKHQDLFPSQEIDLSPIPAPIIETIMVSPHPLHMGIHIEGLQKFGSTKAARIRRALQINGT
jgi:hypothetical protein